MILINIWLDYAGLSFCTCSWVSCPASVHYPESCTTLKTDLVMQPSKLNQIHTRGHVSISHVVYMGLYSHQRHLTMARLLQSLWLSLWQSSLQASLPEVVFNPGGFPKPEHRTHKSCWITRWPCQVGATMIATIFVLHVVYRQSAPTRQDSLLFFSILVWKRLLFLALIVLAKRLPLRMFSHRCVAFSKSCPYSPRYASTFRKFSLLMMAAKSTCLNMYDEIGCSNASLMSGRKISTKLRMTTWALYINWSLLAQMQWT